MKILHVIADLAPRYGGPSKACWEMARAVAQLGHEVSIYTTNQDGPGILQVPTDRPVWREGVEVRYFPIQPPGSGALPAPGPGPAAAIPAVDLVHIHSLYLFHDLVAGHYCRKYASSLSYAPHGTLDPFMYRRHRGRKRFMECVFENRNIRRGRGPPFHHRGGGGTGRAVHLRDPGSGGAPGDQLR